jgi:hypothetical protein
MKRFVCSVLFHLFSEIGSHHVVQASLELLIILLPQPPQCWDYGHALLSPAVLSHVVNLVK